MVIDPRRIRRGQAGQFVLLSKAVALASFGISSQLLPVSAHSQQIIDPAGTWRYAASLSADETWSDNINLAPAGSEKSDFVTTINPSFHMNRSGSRLNVAFDYSPSYYAYARGTNGSGLRNSLSATANASLIENLLSFDASANVSQANISPFGTQAANTVNGSTNRTEARSYSFGPTLQSRFGSDITYSLGYHYIVSSADSSAIATSHSSELFGTFQTSTSFTDLGVGVSINRSEQGYGSSNNIVTESGSLTLTYVLQPTIHLRASTGFDHDSYPTVGQQSLSGISYSAGFDWQPSRHTTVNVTYGHRHFGPTANISIAESTPLFTLSASYGRDQTTSSGNGIFQTQNPYYQLLDQSLRGTITDPAARAQAVATILQQNGLSTSQFTTASFYSNQLYLSKHMDVAVSFRGLNNTVTLDASRGDSQGLSNLGVGFDVFNQSQRFRSTSYSANWSHPLGARTSLSFTAVKTRNYAIEGTGDTRSRSLVASASRQISKYVSASALYRNTVQTGSADSSGFFSGNTRENAVLGSLHITF